MKVAAAHAENNFGRMLYCFVNLKRIGFFFKQKFPFLKQMYWGTDGIWSDGYFVSTVGVNEQTIQRYIENQGKEDSGQALLELSSKPRA